MPISKYFKGHGEEVMSQMKKKHGSRAEEVFHRTANKMKRKPHGSAPFKDHDIGTGYLLRERK